MYIFIYLFIYLFICLPSAKSLLYLNTNLQTYINPTIMRSGQSNRQQDALNIGSL